MPSSNPAAQLVEHADFFDQPQRMIERQQINQRAEAQLFGALRQRGEENSRRSRAADRRAVMLGEMIGVEARAVVSLGKPQAAGKQLAMRNARIVHVVEDAEFHGRLPLASFRGAGVCPANPESIITDWEGVGNRNRRLPAPDYGFRVPRGACHRAGHFGPDPLARPRNDGASAAISTPA